MYSTAEPEGKAKGSAASSAATGEKGIFGSYAIYGGTFKLYNTIKEAAAYSISSADRKADKVERLPDGEELGQSRGPWHKALGLPPTFSTWSHVTMLHLYVLIARARCLEPEAYNNFYYQLVEHFFQDCETVMDANHNLSSKALRQRFLKDLFVQWRGILTAYDEGIARGDAVLASAVWRNLFKAREDVDVRAIAAVVSWIRATLWDLERRTDEDVVAGASLLRVPIEGRLEAVDEQVLTLENGAAKKPAVGAKGKKR